jgi:hypothetical protein
MFSNSIMTLHCINALTSVRFERNIFEHAEKKENVINRKFNALLMNTEYFTRETAFL